MKALNTIHYSSACSILMAALVSAGAQVPPAPAALPAPPAAPAPPGVPAPPDEIDEVHRIVARAQRDATVEMSRAYAAQEDAHRALAKVKGDIRWMAGAKGSRVMVIPAGEPEADTVSQLEEDLTIMGRLIEKTVGSKEGQPKALGIDVLTFAGPAGAQHLYVGGHGAIFTLRVKFPLSAPPKETTKEDKADEKSSTWEDARREVFGPSGFERTFKEFDRSLKDQEEYDAGKVEQLQDSIIDSLKHATHIRHLTPDERVTVVVTGGSGGMFESRIGRTNYGRGGGFGGGTVVVTGGSGGMFESRIGRTNYGRGGGFGGGTARVEEVREKGRTDSVLTIQAKKSDVDAFAKGNMDSDAFRKKVTIMRY